LKLIIHKYVLSHFLDRELGLTDDPGLIDAPCLTRAIITSEFPPLYAIVIAVSPKDDFASTLALFFRRISTISAAHTLHAIIKGVRSKESFISISAPNSIKAFAMSVFLFSIATNSGVYLFESRASTS